MKNLSKLKFFPIANGVNNIGDQSGVLNIFTNFYNKFRNFPNGLIRSGRRLLMKDPEVKNLVTLSL